MVLRISYAGCLPQCIDHIGLFPADAEVFPSHMAIACQCTVDRAAKVQTVDNGSRAQVKDLLDGCFNLCIRDAAGAKGVNHDRDRVCNADCISQLNLALVGKSGGNNVFRDPACCIGCTAVDLGRVLAGESAAAVTGISAVGVDNDLASGQAGVAGRTADDKSAGRVDKITGLLIQQFCRMVGVTTSRRISSRICSREISSACWVETTMVSILTGRSSSYIDGDLGLSIGTQIGRVPFLRTSVRRRESLCAREMGSGISSGVSSQQNRTSCLGRRRRFPVHPSHFWIREICQHPSQYRPTVRRSR